MAVDLARETALKTLYDIMEKGAYSNIALNKHLEQPEMNSMDRAFITELVYGTVKWKLSIDWIIQQFSKVKLKKISPWVLNILRLGVYQIMYTDRIPESAACNESVKLAKKYGHSASSGYVNAVLRNIVRNRDQIPYPDGNKEYERYLSIKYSHPEWMVRQWVSRYGRDFTESLLVSNNEIPDFTVRVNTLKVSRDQLIDGLEANSVKARKGRYADEAVILENPSSITKLDAFKKGYFQVQDESSMLVGIVLDPQPGELVMDVCSAPGGKATHLAQRMQDKGTVIARDIHEHKVALIKEAADRLGLAIIKPEVFDALEIDNNYIGKADRVLVDAPCTGLGIIRKKPDIKWARNEKDKTEIVKLQTEIINAASKYVKPGGVLVYSTCTIEPEENEEVVRRFVENNRDFKTVDISDVLPKELDKKSAKEGYIQLYPNIDGVDGFFIAKLVKGDK